MIRIGLTYDLRDDYRALGLDEELIAEFDSRETIDCLADTLASIGYEVERVGNADALQRRLLEGARWDLVFNVAEGLYGFGREALVPALLDAKRIPYTFSDPMVCALTLHKAMAKRIARDIGIPTAEFTVVERAEEAEALEFPTPAFAKPLAEGTSKGINADSCAESLAELRRIAGSLLARFEQPVLIERYLPGREVTVGLLGTGVQAEALGALEVAAREGAEPGSCSFQNKERCEELLDYYLCSDPAFAEECCRQALQIWRAFGCRDAGRVDFRADENGQPCFLEVNPLAGLHPSHSDLPILCSAIGLPYRDLLGRIVGSALLRTALAR